jgi:hypothetical protein
MMQISTTQFDNKFRKVDLHAIRVDGKLAYQMSLTELHAFAKKKGVPRILPNMSVQDVILRIGVWQLEQQEAAE